MQESLGVASVEADCGQRLVELMVDTRRQFADGGQLRRLDQFIPGMAQLHLSATVFLDFMGQAAVGIHQVAGTLRYATFHLVMGLLQGGFMFLALADVVQGNDKVHRLRAAHGLTAASRGKDSPPSRRPLSSTSGCCCPVVGGAQHGAEGGGGLHLQQVLKGTAL